jgi:hypothetical protein
MPGLSGVLAGPSRAVTVLALTQVLTWGILIYPPVLTMPSLTASHGWSLAFGMAGFSLGLIVSGLLSPTVCGLIDRHGGRGVMVAGALAGAVGLAGLAFADHPVAYFACWLLMGAAMSASLYDAAFATLTTVFGATARRQITLVTFAGGFASTVGWPATHLLLAEVGWRGTYLVFAAVFAFVIAPLHGLALPRGTQHAAHPTPESEAAAAAQPAPHGRLFLLLATGFALYSFILSGLTSNLLAMLQRGGIAPASAVAIGALFGPAQVAARMADFVLAGRTHPLWIARGAVAVVTAGLAMLAFGGLSVWVAAAFAIGFGAANGVMTIARGALPLVLFGPIGYGRVIGRIARPALVVQALAPFLVASAIERFSDSAVLQGGVVAALVVLMCFLAISASPQGLHRK